MELVSKTIKCMRRGVITLVGEAEVKAMVKEWLFEEDEVVADMVEELVEEETRIISEYCLMALMPLTQVVRSPALSGTNLDQMAVHMLRMKENERVAERLTGEVDRVDDLVDAVTFMLGRAVEELLVRLLCKSSQVILVL
jgi:hypothetical protein